MRHANCSTWIIASKQKIMENKKHTWQDLEYWKKQSKMWKMRNAHFRPGIW